MGPRDLIDALGLTMEAIPPVDPEIARNIWLVEEAVRLGIFTEVEAEAELRQRLAALREKKP